MSRTGRPVTNKHKVPKSQWGRWSPQAQKTFNAMYRSLRPSMQFAFLHLGATPMSREHWETTRWNVAWEAACIADGQGPITRVVNA
jgi:hypothetical protein